MNEPMADIEVGPDVWETHASWPVPTTQNVDLYLRPGTTNGLLGISQGTSAAATSFLDSTSQSENTMINNPTNVTNNRRVFLSDPLAAPLRISGTPFVKLVASANRTDTNLGGIIVDYGAKTQISRTGDGITTLGVSSETCWGLSSPADDACYRETAKLTTNVTQWRVAKGILDAVNRDSIETPTPLVAGQAYDFTWDLLPNDYTFPAGHRIGIVIVGSYSGFSSQTDSSGATITLDLQQSRISLPIVGGYQAAVNAGGFLPDVNAPTVTVPDDIVVDAVGPAGVAVTYSASVSDIEDPAPVLVCEPASGSVFPIGTTIVTCTGTDGAGNATVETFEVHVKSAPEQLDDLIAALAGVGPGTAYADKATIIRDHLLAGETALACADLQTSFPSSVTAQIGKKLTAAQAADLLAEIAHIATVAGCP
jgi:X-Pro dipeptidyl-peptidase